MVIQMRLQSTPGMTGTQAKVMMYMMPAVLFLVFNQWASGLNLYYLVFNILSAIQQHFINSSMEKAKAKKATTNSQDWSVTKTTDRKKTNGAAPSASKGSRKAKP